MGARSRALAMACATRRAKRSSPKRRDHLAHLVDARPGEPCSSRLTTCRVHAHIERTIGPEAESALGLIELRGRYAKVKEHAGAWASLRIRRHESRELRKRRVLEREAQLAGEAPAARRDGLRIAVKREHAAFSTQGLENACRVAAAPERCIDIVPTRPDRQCRVHFIDEHCGVLVDESDHFCSGGLRFRPADNFNSANPSGAATVRRSGWIEASAPCIQALSSHSSR